MCVDFWDLDKVCPKDSYPLQWIDQLVNATIGHKMLSFMDAYSGYNQIWMHPEDEAYTTFYVDDDILCYKVMSFILINAGATFHRMFKKLMGRNMEAYVDNMFMKSIKGSLYIEDLREAFECM